MQFTLADTEVRALIRLLDDPDDGVYKNVSDRLVSFGKNVIPHLETAWETNLQNDIQSRIEDIIQQIEFMYCKTALLEWKNAGATDLFEGVVIASMFKYPEQPLDTMRNQLELLRKDVWLELNDNLTSLEKIRVLNHILYEVHHFSPFVKYQSTDQYWFLANAMDQHKGSPTILAILYKTIADRLELPVVGIDLPNHFILGYQDIHQHTEQELLFYINPFSKGAVFGKGELERYMEKMALDIKVDDLKPISNSQIIKRLLIDLKSVYKRLGKYRMLDMVDQLLNVL